MKELRKLLDGGILRPSLQWRLLAGVGVIAVLMLVAASIVFAQLTRLVGAVDSLREARQSVAVAMAVRHDTTDLIISVTRLLPAQDADVFSDEVALRLEDLKISRERLVSTFSGGGTSPAVSALENVDSKVTNVINIAETMVRQARNDQWHSVIIRVGLLNRDQEEVIEAVDGLLQEVQAIESAATDDVSSAERAVLIYPSLVFLIALILGASLISRIIAGVTQPVLRLTESATQLAAGAFDERVVVDRTDEIGQLARAFNTMADQLEMYYQGLEERVAERTKALETSLKVSRRLSTILDRETLVREVVEQVQDAFDYYHVHIYLFDASRENLLMVGGTGQVGRKLLTRGHRLQADQGLVGRTAARNEVTLVPDVSREPDWLPNPLLPDTQAELAVPISFGGEVQGVLDVQQDRAGGLNQSDVTLLQMIAAQVAVALQNARLLEQAKSRAERATLLNTISQRIQDASSVEDVLQIAARELGRALPVQRTQVEISAPGALGAGNSESQKQTESGQRNDQ